MATVPHVTSGLWLRKFQADGFLLTRVYKISNNWKALTQVYCTLYTTICKHRELLNDIDNTIVMLLSNVWGVLKKSFRGRRQAHYFPNIAHFKLLLRSDENTVFGKSFNAVSLGVPNTWPLNCAHIILINSAESPVWYFINILLFHVQKLVHWFSKYVWQLVAHFCESSCFHSWYEKKDFRNIKLNKIPIMTAARPQTLNLKLIK